MVVSIWYRMPSPPTPLAESLPVIVFETGRAGAWTQVNALWHQRTQQPVDAALDFGWLAAVHEDERVEVDLQWRAAFARHQPIDLEFRMRPIGGESVWSREIGRASCRERVLVAV